MTMENTSKEAMPGHYVTGIFSEILGVKAMQSFQCLHLGKVHVRVNLQSLISILVSCSM